MIFSLSALHFIIRAAKSKGKNLSILSEANRNDLERYHKKEADAETLGACFLFFQNFTLKLTLILRG